MVFYVHSILRKPNKKGREIRQQQMGRSNKATPNKHEVNSISLTLVIRELLTRFLFCSVHAIQKHAKVERHEEEHATHAHTWAQLRRPHEFITKHLSCPKQVASGCSIGTARLKLGMCMRFPLQRSSRKAGS